MAGGLSPRDIELIFKANTRGAARDVNTLGSAIDDVRTKLAQQSAEANKGIDVVDDLKATYKELTSALEEVKDNTAAYSKAQKAAAAEDAQANKVEDLRKKLKALADQLAATEKPTKSLQNSVDKATANLASAEQKLDRLSAAARETGAAFETVGGDAENLFRSQAILVGQAKALAAGIVEVEDALATYTVRSNEAALAATKLAEASKFNEAAATSGLPTAQIEYIRDQENAYVFLQAAIKEAAAQKKSFDSALESQATKVAADTARSLAANLDQVEAAEQRITQNRAFAVIAQDSIDAANNQVRFKTSLDGSAVSATKLATAIRAIVDPTSDALRTVQGVNAQIDAGAATLDSPKKLRTSQYQDALNSTSQAGAALGRQAQDIDQFKDQQAAVDAATAAFVRQQAVVLDLAHALQTNENATADDVRALRDEEAALEKTGSAMAVATARLNDMSASLKKAGVDTDNLAAHERTLEASAQKAANTIKGLSQKTGATGEGGFLGLKPYELQNLSYQINDVVTGLASGQRPFQVLAQQGGQIGQIFEGFNAALIANLPLLLGVGAAAGVAYLAYSHLAEEAKDAKDAVAILARTGENAGGSTKESLTAAGEALNQLGLNADKAKPILQDLVNKGFDPTQITAFIALGKDVAAVYGGDVPTALKDLSDGFDGSYTSVAKLDDKLNFLTVDQRDNIRAMFEAGDQAGALATAQAALTAKVEAAHEPTSVFSQLLHNLRLTFDDLVDGFQSVNPFSGFTGWLHDAGVAANYLLMRMRGIDAETAGKAAVNGTDPGAPNGAGSPTALNNTDPNSPNYIPLYGSGGKVAPPPRPAGPPQRTKKGDDDIDALKQERDIRNDNNRKLQQAAVGQKAYNDELAKSGSILAANAARQDALDVLHDKYAKKDAETAKQAQAKAEAAARRAAALQKQIADQGSSLAKSLGDLTTAAAKGGAETLEAQIKAATQGAEESYNSLIQKADEFAKLGGKSIGGMSIADYKAAARAQTDIIEDEKTLAVYTQNVNDLIKARDDELKAIQDKVNSGDVKPGDGLKEAQEVTSRYEPLIAGAAKAGVEFAKGIKSGADAASTKKATAAFNNVLNGSTGSATQANRGAAKDDLSAGLKQLDDTVSARDSVVKSYTALASEGFISAQTAQANIAKAYSDTTDEIQKQITAIEALIDAAQKAGAITPETAEAYRSSLKLTSAETNHLTDLQKNLKTAFQQTITKDIVSTIQDTAKALANVAIHGGSVTKVFEGIAEGFVKLIADVLETVATLILEALVLSAVDKATGGLLKPLLQITGAATSVLHEGGIAGSGGSGRSRVINVSPSAIAAAPRYHSGTPGAGLGTNEVLSVLEKGEAVLPEDHPDHPANKNATTAGGSSASSIRQVLVLGDDEVAGAMAGGAGEKTVMTHIKRNATTIKQVLGVK